MKRFALALTILGLVPALAFAECESSPTRLETAQRTGPGVLLLKRSGRYYSLESCVTISRSQFGRVIKLGFLNNFEPSEVASFYSAKAKRTFSEPPIRSISLVRTPNWYLALPGKPIQLMPAMLPGEPYIGSMADWNHAHADGANPDSLHAVAGLAGPWHAFTDDKKSLASTLDISFWRIDPARLTPNTMHTNYLIRFTPSRSLIFLDFDVFIQEGVEKVEVTTASQNEALSHRRTFKIIP